jgi:hypothetical protein
MLVHAFLQIVCASFQSGWDLLQLVLSMWRCVLLCFRLQQDGLWVASSCPMRVCAVEQGHDILCAFHVHVMVQG